MSEVIGDFDIPPCPSELIRQFEKEWEDPELQEEFLEDFDLYRAYRWAEERHVIKYNLGYDGDLERINEIQRTKELPYCRTKMVKDLAASVQARKAGKGRIGKEGTLKKLIRRAMELRNIETSNELYLAFDDGMFRDEIDDPYDPLPWLINGVDWINQEVKFERRSDSKEVTRTFSRISSTLSDLKK